MATPGGIDIGLTVVLIAFWLYVLWLLVDISSRAYGSQYTSVIPNFMATFVLLLTIQLMEHPFWLLVAGTGETTAGYVFSLQTVQILAGIFLLRGLNQLYNIEFATAGFRGVE